MLKKILLLFSFFITLLELQAQTRVLKGKVADADTRAPLASVSIGAVGGTTLTSGIAYDTTCFILPLSFLLFNTNDITV